MRNNIINRMRINENIILNVDNTLISNIFFLMYIKYI